jgi:protein SCO1/2
MIVRTLLLIVLLGSDAWAASDLSGFAYDQRLGEPLPLTATFTDEYGGEVTLRQLLRQRPAILALSYFHCPNLCGLVRDDLLNALSRMKSGQDYGVVVLSIDPSETPADAKAAGATDMARYGTTADLHYVTGSASAIRAVTDAVGFRSRFDPETKQFLHPAGIVFLTGDGTVSGYLLGLGYQPGDVSLGITRAAGGIGARALPVLLLCFHFDPVTGRYTLAVMRVLQLGAAITVLVVGGTMMLALRRERRPR